MARGGRPVERPAHLSAQERRFAQEQTARWRRDAGLSQPEIAAEVMVARSTYRRWEAGREPGDGPTRRHAEELDQVLQRRLGARYQAGAVLRVWGWPTTNDLSFDGLAGLLGPAGFDMPGPRDPQPSVVLWVHRLKEPNLLHAVFSLAAAAATRAGWSVRLLLDDMDLPPRTRPGMRAELEARILAWFAGAAGQAAKLSVRAYSEVLTGELLAERGWQTVTRYLGSDAEVLGFLLASKVVSPMQYSTQPDESVLRLVRQAASLKVDRLLTALRNWILFEQEIAHVLGGALADDAMPVVTLGGEDERFLWDLWHRCCPDEQTSRVQHIYLRPMPMPNYRAVWQEPALAARTSRPVLADYLRSRTLADRNFDLMEWITRAAVGLPAELNAGYQARIDPMLTDAEALVRRAADDLTGAATAVAKAIVEWLNP